MDEFVAFATGFGSSTHHTQSPKPRLNPTRPKPRLNTITPNLTNRPLIHVYTLHNPTSHTILFTPPPKHSIHPSIYHLHTHPYTDAYTLTRLIVNKLLTLYISIDILTFMWYNKDNEKGPFYMLNI